MSRRVLRTIAIVGGGPAGATLGAFLARAGRRVVMFSKGKRPPIIVGESLVPAIVPFLRRLGIEEEVAAYSIRKEGATFVFDTEERLNIRFDDVRGARTTYSYNVPRDRLDASIRAASERAGVTVIDHTARLQREGDSERLRLSDDTLAAAPMLDGQQPDWIVDATGRGRGIAKLLDIPAISGDRRDTALHAHLEGVSVEIAGNVHTDRLERGWCWRIPLPGRVSVGIIVDGAHLKTFGDTVEEQFDSYLCNDPIIRDWAKPATRITPVVKYSNYQLRSTRGVGPNWAMLGDAFGFVDPVFSSGLLIAFDGADQLAAAILDGSEKAFQRYEARVLRTLESWQGVTQRFYDGRLLTLFKVGEIVRHTPWGRIMDFHFRKHMPRVFTGENAESRYSLWLVEFMATHGLFGHEPDELRIH